MQRRGSRAFYYILKLFYIAYKYVYVSTTMYLVIGFNKRYTVDTFTSILSNFKNTLYHVIGCFTTQN